MFRLIPFFAVFLFVYTAMHALIYWGLRPLLSENHRLPVILLMAFMIFLPFLGRILDRSGMDEIARPLALAGFTWMGFSFLAFSLFALVAVWDLLRAGAVRLLPAAGALPAHGSALAAAVLLLAVTVTLYGMVEAQRLKVETVHLQTEKLPPGVERIRVVQISDLHLGLLSRERTARKVVGAIEAERPDILVATGDLIDAQIDHLTELADILSALDPPLGKYAVTGNHEVYAGVGTSVDFLRRAGFTFLHNETLDVAGVLTLAGVDDPAAGPGADEPALLRQAEGPLFTILLKHRPQVNPASVEYFDLQLSGHTHRGQIFPFNLLTGLVYPLQDGLYPLDRQTLLYTSRGTGTWGPPIRVLAPPEISVFDLIRIPAERAPGN